MQIFVHTVKHCQNTGLTKQMYSGKEARRKPDFFPSVWSQGEIRIKVIVRNKRQRIKLVY